MRPFDHHTAAERQGARFIELVEAERSRCLSNQSSEPPTASVSSETLIIAVRQRPLNAQELAAGQFDVLTCLPDGRSVVLHEPRKRYNLEQDVVNHKFSFDSVFGSSRSNGSVYRSLLGPRVALLDKGAQITLFAFGQTGSGKTHSISSLIQRSMDDVFALITVALREGRHLALGITYFEVYCNAVYDLLAPGERKPLPMREDASHAVQVIGLTEHSTRDPRVARAVVSAGAAARHTGTTRVNAKSSRSHAVLQLNVREEVTRGLTGRAVPLTPLVGKLCLVDLAGSEHASEADHSRIDRTASLEAAEINRSLLALKECIRAMGRVHRTIPRRDQHRPDSTPAAAWSDSETESCDDAEVFSPVVPRPGSSGRPRSATGLKVHSDRGRSGSRPPSSSQGRRKSGTAPVPHIHLPFRGSKLTQILRDCFVNPDASTIMLTTVGPSHEAAEHTLNTLRYAARLKRAGDVVRTPYSRASATLCDASASCSRRIGVLWGAKEELWPGGTKVVFHPPAAALATHGAAHVRTDAGVREKGRRLPADDDAIVGTASSAVRQQHLMKPRQAVHINSSEDHDSGMRGRGAHRRHEAAPAPLQEAVPQAAARLLTQLSSERAPQNSALPENECSYVLVPRAATDRRAADAQASWCLPSESIDEGSLVAVLDAQIRRLTALRDRALHPDSPSFAKNTSSVLTTQDSARRPQCVSAAPPKAASLTKAEAVSVSSSAPKSAMLSPSSPHQKRSHSAASRRNRVGVNSSETDLHGGPPPLQLRSSTTNIDSTETVSPHSGMPLQSFPQKRPHSATHAATPAGSPSACSRAATTVVVAAVGASSDVHGGPPPLQLRSSTAKVDSTETASSPSSCPTAGRREVVRTHSSGTSSRHSGSIVPVAKPRPPLPVRPLLPEPSSKKPTSALLAQHWRPRPVAIPKPPSPSEDRVARKDPDRLSSGRSGSAERQADAARFRTRDLTHFGSSAVQAALSLQVPALGHVR